MRKTVKRTITFFLAMVLMLSLCACTQKQQAVTEYNQPTINEDTLSNGVNKKMPVKPSEESDVQLEQMGFSEEAEQSLEWLRMRMDFPEVMFGVAYLGYVGEASVGDWLSEADQAMLQNYPFISEIDESHTVGADNYLYCLVPLDENATVSINLVRWPPKSANEEVIEVLYRSESGDPVLFLGDCGDDAYAYLSYVQVQIVDNAGNSCVWYPQLDAMGHIVPCLSETGENVTFDFTEYGWLDAPSELVPWLSAGYSGVYGDGLAGCWTTQAIAWDTDCTADYYLWFFSDDKTSGKVDLYWEYEGADPSQTTWKEIWSGFWSIESVMDGPSYLTISLSLVGGDNYGVVDGPYYISDIYPLITSPSGEEMVIGAGLNGVSLPFMPRYESQLCVLTMDNWLSSEVALG